VLAVAVAVAVAILRSGQYGIDVAIIRTLICGSLTILLVATFAGTVLVLDTSLGPRRARRGRGAAARAAAASARQAGGLAIEIARLRVELHRHLADVRTSCARIVTAATAERRRIERDLHDGTQERLVAIGLALDGVPPRRAARARRHRRRRARQGLRPDRTLGADLSARRHAADRTWTRSAFSSVGRR